MRPFTFDTTSRIRFQEHAAMELGDLCGNLLGERVLFVTDKELMEIGLTQAPLRSLEQSGIHVTVFDEVTPDPTLKCLMAAVDWAVEIRASGIVGFGGGSAMDVAKLTALLVGSGEEIEGIWGVDNAQGPRLPLVLVPTTAGTGSEVTPISIITVNGCEKRGVSSPVVLPDVAVLDPLVTVSLPPGVTAATGMDAIVHAIEAFASRSSNRNLMSKTLAVQALTLLGANIETAVADGTNIEARGAMLLGSMLAGMAFANSPVGAVHALAYPIGAVFHVPHGLSNTLVLPHVLRFNTAAAAEEYAELAPHLFPCIDMEQGRQATCAELIERLSALSARLGLKQRLREVGVSEDDLPGLAKDAMLQTRLLVNNPREVGEEDALSIYRAAW